MSNTSSINLTHDLTREVTDLQAFSEALRVDVDQLREDQALLAEARDDYAEIYDLTPVPILTIGAKGAIRSANLAAAELLGRERRSLVLEPFYEFIQAADRARVMALLAWKGGGRRVACETVLTLGSGEILAAALLAQSSWRRPGVQHLTLLSFPSRAPHDLAAPEAFAPTLAAEQLRASHDR